MTELKTLVDIPFDLGTFTEDQIKDICKSVVNVHAHHDQLRVEARKWVEFLSQPIPGLINTNDERRDNKKDRDTMTHGGFVSGTLIDGKMRQFTVYDLQGAVWMLKHFFNLEEP